MRDQGHRACDPHGATLRCLAGFFGVLLACLFAGPGFAQFPSRALKLVSPFPPGGGVDIVGRMVAQGLSARLGQPVVAENIAGASGTIGVMTVARAAPDGHTLLFGSPSTITIAENFAANPDYNPGRDLVPVALTGRYFATIVVNPSVPAGSLRQFVAQAKAYPRKFFYGTPGHGHAFHLMTELFSRKAGIEMVHVPFRGSGPGLVALLAGDVQFMVQSSGAVRNHLREGRLRAIATLESSRLESLPAVPTMADEGLENLGIVNWFGLFVPARTPADLIERLERETFALEKQAGFAEKMKQLDYDPVVRGGRELAGIIERERAQWRAVILSSGIKAKLE
ncbi:MAG: tripartite tricarboxylate transporter substrate binding protein [Burkholderiales bacterium]|nr:tripartite tricarboxylate transporter substrate binding protein [Burkholderiales bacterium]